MGRNPLLSLLVPGAAAIVGLGAVVFAVGGLGGLVVLATFTVVVVCLLARLDWSREDLGSSGDQFAFEPSVARADGATSIVPSSLSPVFDPEWRGRTTGRAAFWMDALVRRDVPMLARLAGYVVTGFVGLVLSVFLLRGLATNPVALFCDEAEIGLEAWRLLHRQAEVTTIPIFYQHFAYDIGSLPVLWTAPFVAIFGLGDFAVRLAAVVPIMATLVVVYLTLRRLTTPFALVAVALFAFSPVVIHLARINFGHGPSLLLIALGFDRFVAARQTGRARTGLIAGLLLGTSAYGNPSMLVVAPLIVGALCLSELLFNGRRWHKYRTIGLTVVGAVIAVLPQVYRAVTDDQFWVRFREKNISEAPLLSGERLGQVAENYGKYFNFDYLFRVGEIGMPGAFITRHSVPGVGELNEALLPIVILAFVTLVLRWRQPETRFFLPWFIVALLYPASDVLTTTSADAPYTVALFGSLLCVPYVAGYAMFGLRDLARWAVSTRRVPVEADGGVTSRETEVASGASGGRLATAIAGALLLWVLVTGWQFYTGPYAEYPNVSANYWGWQYGPEPMIQYFLDHQGEYDEFIMDGDFNQAYVFLDFYIRDPDVRRRASIGDLSRLDLTKRQLFGMRKESWDRIAGSQYPPKSYLVIDTIVLYPNGTEAMYLLELR